MTLQGFIEWVVAKLRSKCPIHKCDYEVGQAPEPYDKYPMLVCPKCVREYSCSNCGNPLFPGHFSTFKLCHKDECMNRMEANPWWRVSPEIPCPHFGSRVLTINDLGGCQIATYSEPGQWDGDDGARIPVTHWKRLPIPPPFDEVIESEAITK